MILLHSMVFSIIGFYFIRGSSSLNDFDFIIWFVAPTDFTSFLDYHHKILLHLLVCRNLGFYFISESSSLIFFTSFMDHHHLQILLILGSSFFYFIHWFCSTLGFNFIHWFIAPTVYFILESSSLKDFISFSGL